MIQTHFIKILDPPLISNKIEYFTITIHLCIYLPRAIYIDADKANLKTMLYGGMYSWSSYDTLLSVCTRAKFSTPATFRIINIINNCQNGFTCLATLNTSISTGQSIGFNDAGPNVAHVLDTQVAIVFLGLIHGILLSP